MLNGQLEPGQAVATQDESKMVIGQLPIGSPTVTGGQLTVRNIDFGGTALASIGTNTTDIAGQWWLTDILVPYNRILTNINFLAGGTSTTDNFMAAIWDAKGNLLAYSAIAGQVLAGGGNTFQVVPLALNAAAAAITTLQLYGPQQYYVGVQGNGTTAGALQTVPATYLNVCCGVVAGTFGTVPKTITLPATFTAAKGPVIYLS